MISQQHDTIAALATPVGIGGISVIRVSGESAIEQTEKIFFSSAKLSSAESHTAHYGTVKNLEREIVDTVLVSLFRNPNSYTGEDVCEISCHGGYFVSQNILQLLFHNGVRPANAGEFTLRAFLNGKLDLAQAEAVADIIHAKSSKSHKTSVEQLTGRLSRYTESLRKEILDICSLLELELDFSQEGIELADKHVAIEKLSAIVTKLNSLIATYNNGKHMREGVRVALVGKPNAGKSSLMNALLKEERAIVSEIPGTTRDTIEETLIIDGLEFIFTDTAGLRESGDIIEQEGIRRTSSTVQSSDIVAVVIDSSLEITEKDAALYKNVENLLPDGAQKIYIFNKTDIKSTQFEQSCAFIKHPAVAISCKSGEGISQLVTLLKDIALPNYDSTAESITVNNLRHKIALENAVKGIEMAIQSLQNNMSDDFVAVDLRTGIDYLGEIIGVTTPDDILNNIFASFCIGK